MDVSKKTFNTSVIISNLLMFIGTGGIALLFNLLLKVILQKYGYLTIYLDLGITVLFGLIIYSLGGYYFKRIKSNYIKSK